MTVIDNIAASQVFDLGGAFTNLPVKDMSHKDSSGVTQASELKQSDLVTIRDASIVSTPVPEPSTSILILIGAGGCLLRRKR